ncbi:HGGxSTG domain-containing protein [Legionella sainthelensi]|uniref:HGGxSTG domain-containing protein n=1 Tax=Legionella sainthelensi TaxID=28087 RepID=UPI000E2086E9|nr:HGGxSTG domain-containing protein [Legionella sainthelensi]
MKNEINPIQRENYPFLNSPRCGARTRKGTKCQAPAVFGKKRCRMHGGAKGSGAPLGSCNALKHGFTTQETKLLKKTIKLLFKERLF